MTVTLVAGSRPNAALVVLNSPYECVCKAPSLGLEEFPGLEVLLDLGGDTHFLREVRMINGFIPVMGTGVSSLIPVETPIESGVQRWRKGRFRI